MAVFATVGQRGSLEIGTLRKCITGIRKRKKCLQRTNLFQIILKIKKINKRKGFGFLHDDHLRRFMSTTDIAPSVGCT